jgi:hypothetical protein
MLRFQSEYKKLGFDWISGGNQESDTLIVWVGHNQKFLLTIVFLVTTKAFSIDERKGKNYSVLHIL